jgi:hypothetical protein
VDTTLEGPAISHGGYLLSSLVLILIGLGLCFLVIHLFRRRLDRQKSLVAALVTAHLLAFVLLLSSLKNGALSEERITWGIIVLSLAPALLLATAIGKRADALRTPGSQPAVNDNGSPEAKQPGSPDEKKPSFAEGLIKGLWAFVAIWAFFLFYSIILSVLLSILGAD